jgi:NTP pyrophosphatase (non-canonical NTP hydrolase)
MEQLPPLGDCPKCGTPLKRMWGEMWDRDLAICPTKNCDYEKELYMMTCHEIDGSIIMFDTREDNEKMVMNDYQKQAFTTATAESQNIYYMTMGMTGEAGEIANKVKKVMRDGKELDIEDIKHELGDVLWYVASFATVLGIDLEEVAQANLDKLASRKARGVIGGSGDNR